MSFNRWTDASGAWLSLGNVQGVDSASEFQLSVGANNQPWIFLTDVASTAPSSLCLPPLRATGVVKYFDGAAWQAAGPLNQRCTPSAAVSRYLSAAIDPASSVAYMAFGADIDQTTFDAETAVWSYAPPGAAASPPPPPPTQTAFAKLGSFPYAYGTTFTSSSQTAVMTGVVAGSPRVPCATTSHTTLPTSSHACLQACQPWPTPMARAHRAWSCDSGAARRGGSCASPPPLQSWLPAKRTLKERVLERWPWPPLAAPCGSPT